MAEKETSKKATKATKAKTATAEKKTTIKKKVDSKKEELLKKAKALEGKLKEGKSDIKEIKGKVRGEEEEKDLLVPIEDYLKASTHLGTRVVTPDMRQYVYRRRADGLAVFNTSLQDDKIREAAEYLAKFSPEQIVIACKREAGWKAAQIFADLFGMKVFTKKYPAGTLTNVRLDNFFEKDLIFICDPWLDKNILVDANKVGIPVFGICDTNNFTKGINFILPANNKSYKSLGMVFHLLAKLYAGKRKLDVKIPGLDEFVEGWETLVAPQ
ncbi:30S ribosomal protein S2 [Candidatus Pacearchaeota archaeon CG10_big_fil_rev_8_21_14_0_10_35_219]|nr:30S ribosomal protein S2 [Candidatus Pacearchaeota archaeon]PIO08068.1 MAG: 30S ribosomal protein S2 [Candidatus Pacearchaeota archaeon CG10_big_fil_rev_8_21_14_0_10_35_219]PIY81581.1 MAG: 30S ribosomal protein S2 [Candidatus Pacearchaeota archaeon CG_4_10_14_0_8_um_filter_35_169]PIZ78956.1 MAG: 30S ribosomal protein S2 [Candidatus Pacearchaeota archaeon CG_4_10_14_0_2_um_filter_35_33]PJA69753.1 MAG: 30S ribosomal protein S2 [Candidatus Pacearchaeota archaeon CG_4_9_14_3_um_filter_35_19]PJB